MKATGADMGQLNSFMETYNANPPKVKNEIDCKREVIQYLLDHPDAKPKKWKEYMMDKKLEEKYPYLTKRYITNKFKNTRDENETKALLAAASRNNQDTEQGDEAQALLHSTDASRNEAIRIVDTLVAVDGTDTIAHGNSLAGLDAIELELPPLVEECFDTLPEDRVGEESEETTLAPVDSPNRQETELLDETQALLAHSTDANRNDSGTTDIAVQDNPPPLVPEVSNVSYVKSHDQDSIVSSSTLRWVAASARPTHAGDSLDSDEAVSVPEFPDELVAAKALILLRNGSWNHDGVDKCVEQPTSLDQGDDSSHSK